MAIDKSFEIPMVFRKLTDFFVPYADEIYSSVEEMIDDGWESLTPNQRENARDFLDELLSGKYTETQLREIWRASGVAISPFRGPHGSCRDFLGVMRSRYEANKDL